MFSNCRPLHSKKFGNSSLSQPNIFIMKKYLNFYFSIWCCIKQKLGVAILFNNLFAFFHSFNQYFFHFSHILSSTLNHKLPFGKTQDYSQKVNSFSAGDKPLRLSLFPS